MPDLEVGYHRSRLAGGTASFTTAEEQGEQVFAVVCRAIKRTWHGLGNDMCMKTSQPEYTGGVHYGSDDSDEDEDEDEDERRDEAGLSEVNVMALADELELGELVDWSN